MSDNPNTSPSGLYAFAECEVVDMQNGGVLLIDKYSDAQLLVAPPVAQSMQLCRVFRTLEQHVEVLTSSIPELAGQQADVTGVLNMLRDAGLMVTAESVCARLNAEVPPPVDLPPTRVFIITCDRPAAVERLLESMLHAGNLTRHEALFLIDDSRDADNAAQNQVAVEKFNLTCPRNMSYFGAAQAKSFMDSLIADLPEQEEAIRFLIDRERWAGHKSYGLARNFTLLLSVGCRAIVMDDDVICAAVESPVKSAGLQFGDTGREVEFYASQQDILSRTTRADFDPLTGHALCLGLSIGQASAKLGQEDIVPAQLAGCSSAYLSQWDANSPILVTESGSLGDPGTRGTDWIYTVSDSSAQRLAAFPGGLEGALASRQYWMGQPRPMFTRMPVISQVTGLNNSTLLPPYFPVFRSEDYLFGAMVEYLHPQSAVLEYAWSVPHFPMDLRKGETDPEPTDARRRINPAKYVTDRTEYEHGITCDTRLQKLASLTRELAETTDRGLTSLFRREMAQRQAFELSRLAAYLNNGNIRPPAWQQWLEQSVNLIASSMPNPPRITELNDMPADCDAGELLQQFRALAGGFASSLAAWDAIRQTARESGNRLLASGTMVL